MAHIVEFDRNGNIIYRGMLSSSEILLYDQLIETLKQDIPQIEQDLKEQYGDSIMYKYNLGRRGVASSSSATDSPKSRRRRSENFPGDSGKPFLTALTRTQMTQGSSHGSGISRGKSGRTNGESS